MVPILCLKDQSLTRTFNQAQKSADAHNFPQGGISLTPAAALETAAAFASSLAASLAASKAFAVGRGLGFSKGPWDSSLRFSFGEFTLHLFGKCDIFGCQSGDASVDGSRAQTPPTPDPGGLLGSLRQGIPLCISHGRSLHGFRKRGFRV